MAYFARVDSTKVGLKEPEESGWASETPAGREGGGETQGCPQAPGGTPGPASLDRSVQTLTTGSATQAETGTAK